MSQQDTKQRIFETAERLFARDGFHSTSLRAITREAGVNLAAVNYHFGSKEALIAAVFERRLVPLNRIRKERLEGVRDTAREAGRRPRARDALQAFIEPTVRFRDSSRGAKDFIKLVGRAVSEPDEDIRTVFLQSVTPLFHLLFEILSEALPDIPREVLYSRLHFALGAMSHTLQSADRWPWLAPSGVASVRDTEALISMLVAFVTAGMEAEP